MTDHLAAAIDSLDVARKAHNPQIAAQAFDTAETEALIAVARSARDALSGLSALNGAIQDVAQELRTANLLAFSASAGVEVRLALEMEVPKHLTDDLARMGRDAARQATEALGLD